MSKRIMVVDDSRLVRVQLNDVLNGTDYEIAAYCRSGEDAIAQYDEVKPDLVTMDIIMQGMDGLDASEHILKEHPDAKSSWFHLLRMTIPLREPKPLAPGAL